MCIYIYTHTPTYLYVWVHQALEVVALIATPVEAPAAALTASVFVQVWKSSMVGP